MSFFKLERRKPALNSIFRNIYMWFKTFFFFKCFTVLRIRTRLVICSPSFCSWHRFVFSFWMNYPFKTFKTCWEAHVLCFLLQHLMYDIKTSRLILQKNPQINPTYNNGFYQACKNICVFSFCNYKILKWFESENIRRQNILVWTKP